MPAVGFEPTISAGERPQTYTLDRAATGTAYGRLQDLILFFKISTGKRQLCLKFYTANVNNMGFRTVRTEHVPSMY
jgi:hypothetical protein